MHLTFLWCGTLFAYIWLSWFRVSCKSCSDYQQCVDNTIDCNSSSNCYVSCYGSKSCYNSNIYNSSEIFCNADSSCVNAKIKSIANSKTISQDTYYSVVLCRGYSSCYNAKSLNLYDKLECDSVLSCGNVKEISFTSQNTIITFCLGLYSCINSIFRSQSSLTNGYENSRSISIFTGAAFDLYNSTVYANGNDYKIYLRGYYSGYGLTVYCADEYDTCTVYCVGLSCLNTTCVSGDTTNNVCSKTCLEDDDTQCLATKDLIDLYNDSSNYNGSSSFDFIADYLNSMLENEYGLTILPTNNNSNNSVLKYINYNNNSYCQVSFYNYTGKTYNNELNINKTNRTNVCCLGFKSCLTYSKSLTTTNGAIYCNGAQSCYSINLIQGKNIHCLGVSGCSNSNISFTKILTCDAETSCQESRIMNGKVLICSGTEACTDSTIINVEMIIGLGYASLEYSTIINASYIYLIGYQAGYQVTIQKLNYNYSSRNDDLPVIYCQNYGCDDMITTLYCRSYTFEQGSIISYFDNCSLSPLPPTMNPTLSPTAIPTILSTMADSNSNNDNVESIINSLSQGTIVIPFVLLVLGLFLVVISFKMTKTKNTHSNSKDDSLLTQSFDRGKYSRHLAILLIFFEIYDVYTDMAYLTQLYTNGYYECFYIFLVSIICTIVVNLIIIGLWLNDEFSKNIKFRNWYFKRSGTISTLFVLFILTDINLIINVFTSQIFCNSVFYAPISINGINMLNISTIISLLIEHLPQLVVQIYVISQPNNKLESLTVIMIGTLIVSAIDILRTVVRGIIWSIFHKTKDKTFQFEKLYSLD